MGLAQAGAITSVATSTAADLTHAELGQDADHKVDGSRSIVSVAVTSTPALPSDTYGAGETIRFTVTFSSGVNIGGSPVFRFSLGNLGAGQPVDAPYESGAGSTALVFGYTVVSTDEDDDGIWIGDQDETLVGTHQTGTITIVATSEAAGLTHAELGYCRPATRWTARRRATTRRCSTPRRRRARWRRTARRARTSAR